LKELEESLKEHFGVEAEELDTIRGFFQPLTLEKGEYFLKAGHYCTHLGFIQQGIIREFLDFEGKEITKWISGPGSFIVDLMSFLFGRTSLVSYQAMSPCILLVLHKEAHRELTETVARWAAMESRFLAKCFAVLENRVINHLALSSAERYAQLMTYDEQLFQQVPLHYIASMLGITPETLSRLRAKRS